jgi:hypothetical protein
VDRQSQRILTFATKIMRFKYKEYEDGEKRIRSGFLFIPKTIGGETRWLETATWEGQLPRSKDSGLEVSKGANSKTTS